MGSGAGARRAGRRLAVAAAIGMAVPVLAQTPASSQATPPPCTGKTSDGKPCPPPPSAAQQFPYPGEQGGTKPAGDQAPDAPLPGAPAPAGTPDAPAAAGSSDAGQSAPGAPAPSAAKQFPYPGESSDSSSSSSSSGGVSDSSSSSSSSAADPDAASGNSSGPPLNDAGSEGENTRRRKLPKVTKLQSDDDREAEDLDVAKFYLNAGNPMAAYLRSKDAVKLKPDDPEAHFSLAEAAAKLKKHDEAVSEFGAYLKLEPDGTHVKAAERSLAELH